MNAPRALTLNPGKKKRYFRILAHQDQAQPNPVPARKGRKSSEPVILKPYKGQGKLGAPLKLKPYEAPPYQTETEIRRRVGMIDDHFLAQYPQIMDEFVPWLAGKAEGGGLVFHQEMEDQLTDMLQLGPRSREVAWNIIEALAHEKVIFEGDGPARLAGPGVGKPPPFTDAEAGAKWALINVGADPNRAKTMIRYLDKMPIDEDGEISGSDLIDFLDDRKKGLFQQEGEFVPDDIGELLDNLTKANVLIDGSSRDMYYYDASIAGRSDPYVVPVLKNRLQTAKQQGKTRSFLNYLQDQIKMRETRIGRAGHFDEPPAGRPKANRHKRVPNLSGYSRDVRPVQDLLPGDLVYEMVPAAFHPIATTVVSVEKGKGDWYTVTVQDGAGKQFTKRKKAGSLIAIEKEVAEKEFDPEYHEVTPLLITDPNLLQILSYFEGYEWVQKQHRFPKCQKCVSANKQAFEVLKSMGAKAKGLTVGMLLDGGGRIEGAKHTKHWYQVGPNGVVVIEQATATDATMKAMQGVGIDSV